jgi:hypothetical protein
MAGRESSQRVVAKLSGCGVAGYDFGMTSEREKAEPHLPITYRHHVRRPALTLFSMRHLLELLMP